MHEEIARQRSSGEAEGAAVLERERRFWNERHHGSYDRLRGLIWRAIGEFSRFHDFWAYLDPQDKAVLDYGCGRGEIVVELVERGARHVTGIDISQAQIDAARDLAARRGIADRTRLQVADAHATAFPDDAFDLVVGTSILHHLDFRRALLELRRILRPGGRAVCAEPLAHNPIIRIGRRLTPSIRTVDEHPLTTADWELCASVFPDFRHYEREFVSIPLIPLNLVLPARARSGVAKRVAALDDSVLARYPRLGKYARVTILVLE